MSYIDVILLIFYLIVAFLGAFIYRSLNSNDFLVRKYFLKGFTAKMIGGIFFAFVYTYYYEYGGDTKAYFAHTSAIYDYFFHDFGGAFKYVFYSNIEYNSHEYMIGKEIFSKGTSEFFTIGIMSILNIFSLNNYFSLTVLFASFSFIGVWKMFSAIASKYPKIHKNIALAILFVPSVFFWGSGVMKDTMVLGLVGIIIHKVYCILDLKKKIVTSSIILGISAYLVLNIKAYVIISLIPAILIWVLFEKFNKLSSPVYKFFIFPFVILLAFVGAFFAVQQFGQFATKYSVDNVLNTAQGMQSWHQVQSHLEDGSNGRGSSYNLGEYDESIAGIAKMILPSMNVTLFRPYITEAKSPAMILSALESLAILIFTITIIFQTKPIKIFRILGNDSFLLMAFLFSLFFAFAVGFTSYNFGALVRYKIPCIPLYLCSLFIIRMKIQEQKKRFR